MVFTDSLFGIDLLAGKEVDDPAPDPCVVQREPQNNVEHGECDRDAGPVEHEQSKDGQRDEADPHDGQNFRHVLDFDLHEGTPFAARCVGFDLTISRAARNRRNRGWSVRFFAQSWRTHV